MRCPRASSLALLSLLSSSPSSCAPRSPSFQLHPQAHAHRQPRHRGPAAAFSRPPACSRLGGWAPLAPPLAPQLQLRGGASLSGRGGGGGTTDLFVRSLEETWRVAEAIAGECREGDLILLRGDVGAGKTTFARGFIRTFTQDEDVVVASPTFLLHLQYDGGACIVHHLDLYRLKPDQDISFLGLDKVFPTGVGLVEWPSQALTPYLPDQFLEVQLRAPEEGEEGFGVCNGGEGEWAEEEGEGGGGGGAEYDDDGGEFELPAMDAPRRIQLTSHGGGRWDALKASLHSTYGR